MDLPYPSIKNNNLNTDFNHLDKLARSILLSTHQIPKQDTISKSLKSKLLKAITSDNIYKLHQLIQKQVLNFNIQIGTRGSRWNILHFCAKNNSIKCTQYVLKTQFQFYQSQYKQFVNQKTIQGYTPIVIAIINRSHKTLEKILQYGSVDIHVLDQQKMTPYQIAINYKNDKAIRQLMNYEPKSKKNDYINKKALSQPLNFPKNTTCCQNLTTCLLNCLTFGLFTKDSILDIQSQTQVKPNQYLIQDQQIDYVSINSRKQLQGYDIQWKKASQLMHKRINLFDSYNPFEIQQNNFTIHNCLILFQCLSQQPWIIRKAIKVDQCKNNNYTVTLYRDHLVQIKNIDGFIPFIKERKEAMFLSNRSELWPMLLQKALAKHYGSYFALGSIDPLNLLESITGFPTLQIKLQSIQTNKIISFLQQISSKNYLYLLRGKPDSDLCNQISKQQCFTILNFYQKNQQYLVLVNCPFISQKWKQHSTKQSLPLKLIKSHYNTHKQMCLWIQLSKLKNYFQSIILSLTFQNYQRSQLKIKTNQYIFFKFVIDKQKQQNLFLSLINTKSSNIYDLSKLQIIKNQGQQLIDLFSGDSKLYNPNLAQLQSLPGQYMCFYQLPTPITTPQNLLLISWSPQLLPIQFIQSQLGILQWIGYLKNRFFKLDKHCVLQIIDQFSLVLLKENVSPPVLLRINVETELIIQGQKNVDNGFVEMITQGINHYCVVKKIISTDEILFDYKKL